MQKIITSIFAFTFFIGLGTNIIACKNNDIPNDLNYYASISSKEGCNDQTAKYFVVLDFFNALMVKIDPNNSHMDGSFDVKGTAEDIVDFYTIPNSNVNFENMINGSKSKNYYSDAIISDSIINNIMHLFGYKDIEISETNGTKAIESNVSAIDIDFYFKDDEQWHIWQYDINYTIFGNDNVSDASYSGKVSIEEQSSSRN